MFNHWFTPLDSEYTNKEIFSVSSIGANIHHYNPVNDDLTATEVVILGIDAEISNAIREKLYPMFFDFGSLNVTDLGNVKNRSGSFIIQILSELHANGIFTIILGSDRESNFAQYASFKKRLTTVNVLTIGDRLGGDVEILNPFFGIMRKKGNAIFHYGHLGYQRNYNSVEVLRTLDDQFHSLVSLGESISNIEDAESIIRYSDMVYMEMSAMRGADAPGQIPLNSSGYDTIQYCKLSRFVGLSDKVKSVSLGGLHYNLDSNDYITFETVAQIIWYLIDGFFQRKQDYPVTALNATQYLVDLDTKQPDHIIFFKNKISGRWWFKVPIFSHKRLNRHKLIPCTYDDYLQVLDGKMPDRLIHSMIQFAEVKGN